MRHLFLTPALRGRVDPTPLIAVGLTAALALWLWRSFGRPEPTRRVRIAPSDPLLQTARERARAELGTLRALLGLHRDTAQLKLRVDGQGEYAGQWADILTWDDAGATIRERGTARERRVAWADVEDWQVELEDGTVRGAFTVAAAWRIRERETGQLPDDARRELPRFQDA